ncbi:MAG: hypothetical protein K940chlam2_01259, partial [Chlamydiae bacterium]|nr:hypothetical protein [Chlamydiota bacterium]
SKSLGNFYTLRDLLEKGYSGMEVRYMLLHTHYRTQLNFTLQGLDAAASSLERLSDFVERLKHLEGEGSFNVEPLIRDTFEAFRQQIGDDLNISPALAALFDLVRKVNQLADDKAIGEAAAQKILAFLKELDAVLGVIPLDAEEVTIPSELEEALARREKARLDKDWTQADKERDFITSSGYVIEDTPHGPRLKKK